MDTNAVEAHLSAVVRSLERMKAYAREIGQPSSLPDWQEQIAAIINTELNTVQTMVNEVRDKVRTKPSMKIVCKDCKEFDKGASRCKLGIGCFPTCQLSFSRCA